MVACNLGRCIAGLSQSMQDKHGPCLPRGRISITYAIIMLGNGRKHINEYFSQNLASWGSSLSLIMIYHIRQNISLLCITLNGVLWWPITRGDANISRICLNPYPMLMLNLLPLRCTGILPNRVAPYDQILRYRHPANKYIFIMDLRVFSTIDDLGTN